MKKDFKFKVAVRGRKMVANEDSMKDKLFSCENNLPFVNDEISEEYLEIANQLNISLIAFENLTLEKASQIFKSQQYENYQLLTSQSIYEEVRKEKFTPEQMKSNYKAHLTSNEISTFLIISRKTIQEQTIERTKNLLSTFRNKYEIISIYSGDKAILKWAAHDRRVDYITVDLSNISNVVDKALCSLVKQNEKCIEIELTSLVRKQNDKDLSTNLRKGKKLLKLLLSTKTPFIFTIKPETAYQLRNGHQMRYLAELLGAPFNKTKDSVFEKQLTILVENTIKLHTSYLTEGIREA